MVSRIRKRIIGLQVSSADKKQYIFFMLRRAFSIIFCTVSGCDGGNRTRNIAVHTWRCSLLSYGRHPIAVTAIAQRISTWDQVKWLLASETIWEARLDSKENQLLKIARRISLLLYIPYISPTAATVILFSHFLLVKGPASLTDISECRNLLNAQQGAVILTFYQKGTMPKQKGCKIYILDTLIQPVWALLVTKLSNSD